jgi:hypothetical protein
MFKKREAQTSLFSSSHLLPDEKRERLERDWPGQFRRNALPLIDEEAFRDLYHEWNGRPNKPVQTVIGVLLLKEMNDLTDAEALGALDYDLRWQVALDLDPSEAHTCQKTLHNFRAKLMESDKGKLLFEEMTGKIISALGVSTERQRLDSTHITSNIARLTRLGLFCQTARVFLKDLRKKAKGKFEAIPEGLRRRYLRDDGTDTRYHDAKSSEAKRRIGVSARDVWRVVDRFKGDRRVEALDSYGFLRRLLDEQCEVVEEAPAPKAGDADANDPPAPVVVKDAKRVRSDSLQTPHDASATYSGRKGKGQEVQLAETCGNHDKPEMITYAEQTRSCDSDEKATVPAVENLAERDIRPEELLADTNYGSTENAIECEKRGTELVSPVPGPKVDEAEKDAITKADFDVDPKGERLARCPRGASATSEKRDPGKGKVRAFFDGKACEGCPHRDSCPAKPLRDGRRVLRTTVHGAVLARRRRYGKTEEFRRRYAERAGIEATNSELKRAHGLGRLRIRGFLRVRLAVYLKALACNVKRMVRHLAGEARKAANAAAAAAEGAEAAADAAACVILRLLRPRGAAPAALVAARPGVWPGSRYSLRLAAA